MDIWDSLIEEYLKRVTAEGSGGEKKEEVEGTKQEQPEPMESLPAKQAGSGSSVRGEAPQGTEAQASQSVAVPIDPRLAGAFLWLFYHAQQVPVKMKADEELGSMGIPWNVVESLIAQEIVQNADKYRNDKYAVLSAYTAVRDRIMRAAEEDPDVFRLMTARRGAQGEAPKKGVDPREEYLRAVAEAMKSALD